jgi:hypothetical protein
MLVALSQLFASSRTHAWSAEHRDQLQGPRFRDGADLVSCISLLCRWSSRRNARSSWTPTQARLHCRRPKGTRASPRRRPMGRPGQKQRGATPATILVRSAGGLPHQRATQPASLNSLVVDVGRARRAHGRSCANLARHSSFARPGQPWRAVPGRVPSRLRCRHNTEITCEGRAPPGLARTSSGASRCWTASPPDASFPITCSHLR